MACLFVPKPSSYRPSRRAYPATGLLRVSVNVREGPPKYVAIVTRLVTQ